MDLIGGYLLGILVLFAINISLLFGNYEINNLKLIICSAVMSFIAFALMYVSLFLKSPLSFLLDNFSYLFFVIFLVIFAAMLYYSKSGDFKISLYSVMGMFLISTALLSSQAEITIFSMFLYSLFVFIVLFCVYQLSKLLHHAKRQYPVIVGEFMCLFSILTFIFALTYNSTRNLDYTMFSPFLILTPTYQLIYVVIAIVIVLVVGVLINESKGGNS